MILFETTESVIEVLWDLALTVFAFRLALIYLVLNIGSALLIFFALPPVAALPDVSVSYPLIALLSLDGRAPPIVVPLLLASAALWARVLIVRYEIPRAGAFRLAIGGVALVLMAVVEGIVAAIGWEEGWWKGEWEGRVWLVLAGVLAWYSLQFFGQMFVEGNYARKGKLVVVEEKSSGTSPAWK